jgi:uncharacterized protein (TIGR00725 family)
MIVGVIGGANADARVRQQAFEIGKRIAEHGAILVCGGLGGVMEAACEGARAAGGVTVGILPGSETTAANPYVTIPVTTGMGIARNAIIVRTADVLIAVDGSYGTLSEIAMALNLGKTVVELESWRLPKAGEVAADRYVSAKDPRDAVEKAIAVVERSGCQRFT